MLIFYFFSTDICYKIRQNYYLVNFRFNSPNERKIKRFKKESWKL
jgi:hypothetical protein